MKKYILYIFLLIPILAWAAATTIISSGNWDDTAIWSGGNIADDIAEDADMVNNIGTATIRNGFSYIISNFDMNNGNTLIIDTGGSLTIGSSSDVQSLNSGNSTAIIVNGNLEIWGDLNLSNLLTLSISGGIIIHGDLNLGNDGFLDIQGNMTIEGDLNGGDNTDINVDGILNIIGLIDVGVNSDLTGSGTLNLGGSCSGPSGFCDAALMNRTIPVILGCPSDISTSLTGPGCLESVSWTEPTSFNSVSFTSTHSPGNFFPGGATTVTYTATNKVGITTTCTFDVIVTEDTAPTISNCPTDIIINVKGENCVRTATWTAPTATDNCLVDSFTSNYNPGDMLPMGTTTVTYTATDRSGNTATCSFDVTVIENINPTISNCPTNIIINTSAAGCGETVNWVLPVALDNCSIVSFSSTHSPGSFFPIGTSTVTYVATDISGTTATCSFDVIVSDLTKPVISNCPADINVSISALGCNQVVSWTEPTATDNCSILSFAGTNSPGNIFPVGTTTVSYIATDASGNSSTCNFNVIVTDDTNPVIKNCPPNIIVDINDTGCEKVVSWSPPSATDNCSITSFLSTHKPGDIFPSGSTTVIYTAMDPSGNTATCSFDVIVNEVTLPKFDFCPTSVNIAEFDLVQQTAIVTWLEPVASDNCGLPTISSNFNSGDSFPAGVTSISYTAIDASGNTANCEFEFEVIGNKLPIASTLLINALSGNSEEICLEVKDPDNDNLIITDISYDMLNGEIEQRSKDGQLCLAYTSYSDFEGEEILYVTVCDDGVPSACIDVEVRISVILDLNLTFYKAFTPNGDNINDVWAIKNIENYPDNNVMIFDRLGGVIFSVNGYDNVDLVWDGRSNQTGQDIAPSGTYFYKIDLGNNTSASKGYVELIR